MPIVRGIPGFYGERRPRPPLPWTGIYFIQQGASGPIKIGLAKHPRRRLNNLQVGSSEPLNLVLDFRGPPEMERLLHGLVRRYHMRGEWFTPSLELYGLIERVRAALNGGPPILFREGQRIDAQNAK